MRRQSGISSADCCPAMPTSLDASGNNSRPCASTKCWSNTDAITIRVALHRELLEDARMRAVGLFSGIGGLELGLASSGIETDMLCESWEPAAGTLRRHFAAPVVGDIRE